MIKAITFDLDNTLIDFMKMKKASSNAAAKAMVNKNIKDLQDLYLIEVDEGFKLTDAGRIMLL